MTACARVCCSMISLTQMAYGSREWRQGRSRWPRAYPASRRRLAWLPAGAASAYCAGRVSIRFSLNDAQPFGDHGEAFRIHVPRFKCGVQRLQADLFVLPLVFATMNLAAGVALDGVARGFVEHAEALDEQNLALPRARRVEPEKIEAAMGNARFHGLAFHVGHEKIRREVHPFGSGDPVFRLASHFVAEAASRGAQAEQGQMGGEALDVRILDVLAIEAVEHAREGVHGDRLSRTDAQAVGQGIFQRLQDFGVFGIGETSEIAAHAEPGPAGIEIDQQHAYGARRPRRQNGLQEYVGTLPDPADGKHAGRHVLILIYLSGGKLWT